MRDRKEILLLLFGSETTWVHDISVEEATCCFGGASRGICELVRRHFQQKGAQALRQGCEEACSWVQWRSGEDASDKLLGEPVAEQPLKDSELGLRLGKESKILFSKS